MKNQFRPFFKNKIDLLLNEKKEIYNFIKKRLYISNNKTRKNRKY